MDEIKDEVKDVELPSQKELERELNEYLARKYGPRVRVVSASLLEPHKKTKDKGINTQKILTKINFDLKPQDLIAYLDQYVVKQDQAKAILATKICTHFNRIRYWLTHRQHTWSRIHYIKNNILMIGPTGVGKTFIIKLIADKLGVPFVKGDATKFSETGYVGGDVEDLVRELVRQANNDIDLAQFGIIYIDEIDKIAASGNIIGPDVSRTGVQRALLKPMEETEVDLKTPFDPISQLEAIEQYRRTGKRPKKMINTRHILFIMSGAFNHLDEIIMKRLNQQGIGFGAKVTSKSSVHTYLPHVKAEDLVEYGFESEFIGRLPVIAVFEPLEKEDLYQILKNPNSVVINAKRQDFRAYGIDLVFEDEALRLLAEKATLEGTGARGLVSVLEKTLLPFEQVLPSTDIKRLVVTKEVVMDPQAKLKEVLSGKLEICSEEFYSKAKEAEKDYVKETIERRGEALARQYGLSLTKRRIELIMNAFEEFDYDMDYAFKKLAELIKELELFVETYFDETGLKCRFTEDAIDYLLEQSVLNQKDLLTLCHHMIQNLEFGLKLVMERTGQSEFKITSEAFKDPDAFVRVLIQRSYYDPEGEENA